jgi:hypothetical protein
MTTAMHSPWQVLWLPIGLLASCAMGDMFLLSIPYQLYLTWSFGSGEPKP